ncbi:MAG: GPR endopeptidase [Christensenellaceae bacterium]|jgi:spore protease|nr:GPR endopeptidase [Christensenellaceae bacterium]
MQSSIYTDLAMEARELHPELQGVVEQSEESEGIRISRIEVKTEEASQKLEKPRGRYVTLDAPELTNRPLDLFEQVAAQLGEEIALLLGSLASDATVLIVGLGNRAITSDSLGPKTVEQVYVTRHVTQYLPEAFPHPVRSVCAIAPGVLGVTGIETMEVVRGVVERVRPDVILAVDALASRRAARISTTLQLTDTGINPGSGVGNTRKSLNQATFGVPVVAIGVPMVVYASTISQDTISLIADETGLHHDEETLKRLAEKVITENLGNMIVTPKDVDQIIADMSRIIADAINFALFDADYDEVRMLIS